MAFLEPVEHVDVGLEVHLSHEAGEDAEDGGLRGPVAVQCTLIMDRVRGGNRY